MAYPSLQHWLSRKTTRGGYENNWDGRRPRGAEIATNTRLLSTTNNCWIHVWLQTFTQLADLRNEKYQNQRMSCCVAIAALIGSFYPFSFYRDRSHQGQATASVRRPKHSCISVHGTRNGSWIIGIWPRSQSRVSQTASGLPLNCSTNWKIDSKKQFAIWPHQPSEAAEQGHRQNDTELELTWRDWQHLSYRKRQGGKKDSKISFILAEIS